MGQEQSVKKEKRLASECGVSWKFLLTFYNSIPSKEKESLTTGEISEKYIKPKTAKKRCRYVDLLNPKEIKKPNYFVSHVWKSPFSHLLECLQVQLHFFRIQQNDLDSLFFWIDIFAVNQHEIDSDLASLERTIHETEQILVCMDTEGRLLTRIWCLYEIWNTILSEKEGKEQEEGKKLVFIAHKTNYTTLEKFFIECDVSRAQAKKEEDVVRILNEIKKSVGFEKVNREIQRGLVQSANYEMKVAEMMDDQKILREKREKFARMLQFSGKYQEAEPLLRSCLSISETINELEHPDTAQSLNNLAALLSTMGKYSEAEPLSEEPCQKIYLLL